MTRNLQRHCLLMRMVAHCSKGQGQGMTGTEPASSPLARYRYCTNCKVGGHGQRCGSGEGSKEGIVLTAGSASTCWKDQIGESIPIRNGLRTRVAFHEKLSSASIVVCYVEWHLSMLYSNYSAQEQCM